MGIYIAAITKNDLIVCSSLQSRFVSDAKRATPGHHYFETPPDQSEENNNPEQHFNLFTNEDQSQHDLFCIQDY